jgi:hypothetical protein
MYFPGGRRDAYTVIEIDMMEGRVEQTQKALSREPFRALEAKVGIAPLDVEITIRERRPHCSGFRGVTGDEAKLDDEVNV